ncbi:GNAT family N-acetyltransferase [Cohnella luojiensis]|uniref:N-acetyltransferase n=1 Tax=Cohnella luojiensis TaxID=652876 RepID=A0A4Y8LRK7_9BACL|nr:GNAT family N-acetyltransferase [Cohnella luojiensis]TFE22658.1 N-acetyltransferase [Cohnella luojiensis]
MKITARFATIEDMTAIAEKDTSLTESQLQWKLNNHEFIISCINEGIIGFLRLEYLWSKIPYIGLIRVNHEHQRKGIGRQLLAFTEEVLANRGMTKLYSSSQANEAEPQQWHRHMGFTECGIINGINDGIGEVLFVKLLSKI